jgi:cell fate (sporulation/competence/biofilm development) regulator YlbF (YheA/YmcA/DUF963 family)
MDSLVENQAAAAAHCLAEGLLASAEYQNFLQSTRAVNRDGQVLRLIREIRECRATYGCHEKGALQSELESLPVMVAYEQASQALSALLAEIDRAVSAAAGVEFMANVRPDRHG